MPSARSRPSPKRRRGEKGEKKNTIAERGMAPAASTYNLVDRCLHDLLFYTEGGRGKREKKEKKEEIERSPEQVAAFVALIRPIDWRWGPSTGLARKKEGGEGRKRRGKEKERAMVSIPAKPDPLLTSSLGDQNKVNGPGRMSERKKRRKE